MIKQSQTKRFPQNYNSLGEFIRSIGGWGKYYQWLKENPIVKVGRNQPCPCGSKKKYKKCCINKRRV
tara:strand:- start:5377 stop:5577 length:201 start_codon:yes stop_codon:yes gene_type:complete